MCRTELQGKNPDPDSTAAAFDAARDAQPNWLGALSMLVTGGGTFFGRPGDKVDVRQAADSRDVVASSLTRRPQHQLHLVVTEAVLRRELQRQAALQAIEEAHALA